MKHKPKLIRATFVRKMALNRKFEKRIKRTKTIESVT